MITAEGDAKAAELLSQSLTQAGDALIDLRRIEAAEEIAGTLHRSPNVAYLPGGGLNLLLSLPP